VVFPLVVPLLCGYIFDSLVGDDYEERDADFQSVTKFLVILIHLIALLIMTTSLLWAMVMV
jgi:hypothetical protein